MINKSNEPVLFSSASTALRNRCKIRLVHGSTISSLIGKELVQFVNETDRYYAVPLEARKEVGASLILQSFEQGILVACLCAIEANGSATSRVKEENQQQNSTPPCLWLSLSTLLDCLGEVDPCVKITGSEEQACILEIIQRLVTWDYLLILLIRGKKYVAEGIRVFSNRNDKF
jgi:hypothetical protein